MKINKTKTRDSKGNQIILVKKDSKLDGFITDPAELAYVNERLVGGKNVALLNRLDHVLIFRNLDKTEILLSTRLENARKAGFELHPILIDHDVESITVINGGVDQEECVAFAEGLALTNYQFLKYLSGDPSRKHSLNEISLHDEGLSTDHVKKLENLVNAVYQTRDLVNEPLSFLNALQLSAEIEKMGLDAGFSTEVFNKKKIESVRAVVFGILKEYWHSGISYLLYSEFEKCVKAKGYKWGETSWQLEDNDAINKFVMSIGGEVYKKFRIYERGVT